MGIDGACTMYMRADSMELAHDFEKEFNEALKKLEEDTWEYRATVSVNGNVVEVHSKDDRSFHLQRLILSVILGKNIEDKKLDWGDNYKELSKKYEAIVEVWAVYDSMTSAAQHLICYKGYTLLEEENPFEYDRPNIEHDLIIKTILPSFNNFWKMTI